jgi:hypothetical protein
MPKSPCSDQTREAIEMWLRSNVRIGQDVAIRRTHGGLLWYERGCVVRLGKGRFEVALSPNRAMTSDSGDSFYYSGKNCRYPQVQTAGHSSLAVLAACEVCERERGPLPGPPWSIETSF